MEGPLPWLAIVVSGSLVGLILGLIGSGGSVLATPLLLYVVGISQPHVALGTGAVAVSVNAYANLIAHARRGNVRWLCAGVFASIGTLGALAGSSLGKITDGQWLLLLFGMAMVVMGFAMLRPRPEQAASATLTTRRRCIRAGFAAVVAGFAAGFFGIGGGFLIVPAMMLATGMSISNAVGSSLLAVGTFGLATALNYAVSGLVDWRVAGLFLGAGIVGGVAGTALSMRLAAKRGALNKIFATTVFIVAAYVLYRSGSELLR